MNEFEFSFGGAMSESEEEEERCDNSEVNLNCDSTLGFGQQMSTLKIAFDPLEDVFDLPAM